MRSTNVAVAIIAGGASSRFGGAPKGLATVGGRRIVDRVIEATRAVASDIVLVANDPKATTWVEGLRVVSDIRPERGSIVGIHTALATTGRTTVVVAWDMPFVTGSLLSLIAERGATESFAVIPEGENGLQPFCALYTPACLPLVEQAIGRGDFRATALPSRFPSFTRVLAGEIASIGEPAELFFNVNSPVDLERAEEIDARVRRSRQS